MCDLLWHTHMAFPKQYARDKAALTGQLFDSRTWAITGSIARGEWIQACLDRSQDRSHEHNPDKIEVQSTRAPTALLVAATPDAMDEEEEQAGCEICMDRQCDTVLIPCRHALCYPCSQRIKAEASGRCPFCRDSIQSYAALARKCSGVYAKRASNDGREDVFFTEVVSCIKNTCPQRGVAVKMHLRSGWLLTLPLPKIRCNRLWRSLCRTLIDQSRSATADS